MNLSEFFAQNRKVAIALSGGVDSAYLLYEAVQNGVEVRPYFVKTAFQPEFEKRDAQQLAQQLEVELVVLSYDVLQDEKVAENPPDRCYYCKKNLFGCICRRAAQDGFTLLVDGTNASDDATDRPGMKALQELQVRSPLRECGIRKEEIRARAQKAGLFLWDKPAYACLATRIPQGEPVTQVSLHTIEAAENKLFAMGFTDFRVRVFHGAARIQMPEEQMSQVLQRRKEIRQKLSAEFETILLDLQERG